jgi:hypothetical protein
MSKSHNRTGGEPRTASAVDPERLADYRAAARRPSLREDVRALMALSHDYETLNAARDLRHALGAGLELIDVALRVAVTPSADDAQRRFKREFFRTHFASLVRSFSHDHVAAIAQAVVAAENE